MLERPNTRLRLITGNPRDAYKRIEGLLAALSDEDQVCAIISITPPAPVKRVIDLRGAPSKPGA
jgi:hypothetical protein